ncbi:MAG: AAA family ATPase [Firmicutes bacterium]|nr:AAA family ATPase [Bacillota bacterium]
MSTALAEPMNHPTEEEQYIEQTRERVRNYLSQSGMSQTEAARLIGFSTTRLSQFLSGKYAGDMLETAKAINYGLDKHIEQQAAPKEPEFALTTAARQVFEVCEYAHRVQTIGLIHGDAGLGKTMALREYTGSHRDVVMISVNPTLSSAKAVLEEISDVLGLKYGSARRMAKEITAALRGSGRLVIFDEGQHLSPKAINTLRAIHDAARVGMVFCGNDELYYKLRGRTQSEYAQFFSRVGIRRQLNPVVAQEDIQTVFSRSGLGKEVLEQLFQVANDGKGIRGCVKTYLLAASLAQARGELINGAHIQQARRFLQA